MEWFKVFVELVGHLAWPVAIVTLVCLFRGQIRGLLDPEGLESVEAGPGGVKLNRRQIEEELSAARTAIETDAAREEGLHVSPPAEHIARMRAIAEIDPPVAVFASAAHLESVLRRRLKDLELLPNDPRRGMPSLQTLVEVARRHGLLTPHQADGGVRLSHIRNEIAHENGRVEMDEGQAMSFCELAWELEDEVRSSEPDPV